MNRFCDLITLITVTKGQDSDGFPTEALTETDILGNIMSVKREEYYNAMRSGIKAAQTVEIHQDDFEIATIDGIKATRIKLGDETYKIGRTYCTDDDNMEITCEEIE